MTSYFYSDAATSISVAPRAGLLIRVTNQFGRSLGLIYGPAGELASVATPDGQSISYAFDSVRRLTGVVFPGGTAKSYLYEDAAWPKSMTGIVDETGTRLATIAYDTQGRAVSSGYAGGAGRYSVVFGATSVDPVQVTDPLGTQRSYRYGTALNKLAVIGATLPGGSGRSDAASRVQNASGLIDSETDFLGVNTMYTWDLARRLPLSITRASGHAEAQTVGTQWHPVFRLPVLVTEAGRSTAYSYDSLGNKLAETITDNATQQTRARGWTYNAQGLVSTHAAVNGGVSQYSYDAQRNLTGITNPLGHVMQLAYDAAGRVIQQTGPTGLVTAYSYDARGRLLSELRGGELSSYSYTPSGLLASATLPNGYRVSYDYDAAQRLTGAADNRGNRTQYTLDAMGNRTREEVKDASGGIARLTSRVINSLNRVAAVQGSVGQSTTLAFDANGELTSATDPLNQSTRQTLDALRRPAAITYADNGAASQAWNALDQLTRVADPKGVATAYQRNAFGDPAAVLPRSDRIFMQPAPDGAVADARHKSRILGMPRHIGHAQAGQRQTQSVGQLASQRLVLNDDLWGEKPGGDPVGLFPPSPPIAPQKAFSPLTNDLTARVKPGGDLIVVDSGRRHENHSGSLNFKIRQRIFHRSAPQLTLFLD